MRVAVLMSDLMLYSRIEAAATAAGASVKRVAAAEELAADGDLVLADWSEREPAWPEALHAARAHGARVILFGRHTDVEAHRSAREVGLGPMWARSKLIAELRGLMVEERTRAR